MATASGSGQRPRTRAVDPARLTRFLDNESLWGPSRSLRPNSRTASSYDPSRAWDGMSCSDVPFSRVSHTRPTTATSKRAYGFASSAVIELSERTDAAVFGTLPAQRTSEIPATLEQQDLRYDAAADGGRATAADSLPGGSHVLQQAGITTYASTLRGSPTTEEGPAEGKTDESGAGQNKVLEQVRPERFENHFVLAPEFVATEKSDLVEKVGPQQDRVLLAPHQRRQLLEEESRQQQAAKRVHRAQAQRVRMNAILQHRYRRGVLGYDSVENVNSEVYQEQARKYHAEDKRKAEFHRRRREYMQFQTSPLVRHGYNPVQYDQRPDTSGVRPATTDPSQAQDKIFQRLRHGIGPQHDTHTRLFRKDPFPYNEARMQLLRDQDICGRNYDLVGTHAITTLPSQAQPRVNKRLANEACFAGVPSVLSSRADTR